MEEAKVVYVIYKVWTAGFLDWLASQGVSADERDAEIARLTASWPTRTATPLDPGRALGGAGRRWPDAWASGIRAYEPDRRGRGRRCYGTCPRAGAACTTGTRT